MLKQALLLPILASALTAQPAAFTKLCSSCHGDAGKGSAQGPGLAMNPRVAEKNIEQLSAYLQQGNPGAGMPSFTDLSAADMKAVATYIKRLNNDTIVGPVTVMEPAAPRKTSWPEPGPADWVTYDGNMTGNRYSLHKQIRTSNVASMKLKWVFPIAHFGLEVTPLVADGVMYVTGPNQVYAIEALTGNPIWHYSRPQSQGLAGDARLGTNKGVALLGNKVFFETDNAHLLALDRGTGKLLWEKNLADRAQPYGGTMAPLIVGDLVIVGVAGGDHGIRGFISAFHAADGELAWKHWTVPAKGEPGIETWKGKEPVGGGGSTWLTGSYDEATGTLYWATGNPWPDSDDRDRPGDNLYTNSVLALDAKTGQQKWHYQYTPHDVKDRDATEPNVLVDTVYKGKPSKLLLHADRNGFFYVLDRTNGKVLFTKPFLKRIDWAKEIGADGRPVVLDPKGCPGDAANWDSTAYSPETRLYYVLTLEECVGKPTGYPDQTGQRFLRAINIDSGAIAWEVPQPGAARAKTWSGVLATAGGLVFYGQPNGGFAAVDQKSGKTLWSFPTNVRMKASPMTFVSGGNQYVAVAAGPMILCFGL